jgi:hypothetical protein
VAGSDYAERELSVESQTKHIATHSNNQPVNTAPPVQSGSSQSSFIPNPSSPVRPASPGPDQPALAGDTSHDGTVVLTYDKRLTMPDFSGKTVRAVSHDCAQLGLDPQLVGSGVARAQQPAAGAAVAPGARVVITFGR